MTSASDTPETTVTDTLPSVTVFVCTSCGKTSNDPNGPASRGEILLDRLTKAAKPHAHIKTQAVDCFAVCTREVTIAFSAPGKWSYVIGDTDPARDIDDILTAATAVANAPHGVPKLKERPAFFRTGVISRIPPRD
ncbi:DUF1636 family protein [Sneathiella chinensis]|uniref:Metal-binding protein n=1 Tax=Sneathiella chinensis TaxID=349750 RepID=A0ABQ5U3Z3_9PROT|nr:DUF1636 domain-containing protein [Sneathiella chinensis]GLQ05958.1 metal-binding protein [Sneathiella chinensis]